jgi:hypothetical protein
MFLAQELMPEGPAPKGQEGLGQGLPWITRHKRLALKGLELRTRSASKVRSQISPYLGAPSGRVRAEAFSQGKPWAMLFWPLRATDWNHPNLFGPCNAKHMLVSRPQIPVPKRPKSPNKSVKTVQSVIPSSEFRI